MAKANPTNAPYGEWYCSLPKKGTHCSAQQGTLYNAQGNVAQGDLCCWNDGPDSGSTAYGTCSNIPPGGAIGRPIDHGWLVIEREVGKSVCYTKCNALD